jgi:3'-phosphoadenosine 5'-phosphosulfate sulfotransferase (PAPS reductase)/FAD synthetase
MPRLILKYTNRKILKPSNFIITPQQLIQKQSLSLEEKIDSSLAVIQEWYEHWNGKVYVSFSGGKDSTVLLNLVRSIYPEVVGVFLNLGLEYPEVKNYIKTIKNITWIRSKMTFIDNINYYGYPILSKEISALCSLYHTSIRNNKPKVTQRILQGREKDGGFKLASKWNFLLNAPFEISDQCCTIMKKNVFKNYEKQTKKFPILGLLTEESSIRKIQYLKSGCNAFDNKRPHSNPLSFWLEKDIWKYIKKYNIAYSTIYDKGFDRTGCMFCLFGIHLEKNPNKFELMKNTHPKYYQFCMEKLGLRKVLEWINKEGNMNIKY